ncbi:MAG: hypothetical protein MJ114_06270 [Acetatifactor sp.]|nr:hypothetical protein [Acetatifactor sp.]
MAMMEQKKPISKSDIYNPNLHIEGIESMFLTTDDAVELPLLFGSNNMKVGIFKRELDVKLRLFACVSYLARTSFHLTIGRMVGDTCLMYTDKYDQVKSVRSDTAAPLTSDEISRLIEIKTARMYVDSYKGVADLDNFENSGFLRSKEQRHGFDIGNILSRKHIVDVKAYNDAKAGQRRQLVEELIEKYQIHCTDSIKYSLPVWIGDTERSLFGKETYRGRLGCVRYTEKLLQVDMTPDRAAWILGQEEQEKLDKINSLSYVAEVAKNIYRMLQEVESLKESGKGEISVLLTAESNRVVFVSGIELQSTPKDSFQRKVVDFFYKDHGMRDITEEPRLLMFVLSAIVAKIRILSEESGSATWGIDIIKSGFVQWKEEFRFVRDNIYGGYSVDLGSSSREKIKPQEFNSWV